MKIEVRDNGTLEDMLTDPDPASETKPQNAKIELNGEEVIRSSNTINDLITGVTLELREVSEKILTTRVLQVKVNTKPNLSPSPKTPQK